MGRPVICNRITGRPLPLGDPESSYRAGLDQVRLKSLLNREPVGRIEVKRQPLTEELSVIVIVDVGDGGGSGRSHNRPRVRSPK